MQRSAASRSGEVRMLRVTERDARGPFDLSTAIWHVERSFCRDAAKASMRSVENPMVIPLSWSNDGLRPHLQRWQAKFRRWSTTRCFGARPRIVAAGSPATLSQMGGAPRQSPRDEPAPYRLRRRARNHDCAPKCFTDSTHGVEAKKNRDRKPT